jgi:hypothetical protein
MASKRHEKRKQDVDRQFPSLLRPLCLFAAILLPASGTRLDPGQSRSIKPIQTDE